MSAPEVLLTTEVDDSYEIDVDGPSYDEPAVLPDTERAIGVEIRAMREDAAKTPSEPKRPTEPKQSKAPREPKLLKKPKPPKPVKAPREPKPAKEPKVKAVKPPKFAKVPKVMQSKPVKPAKVPKPPKTPRPAKVRTDNANRVLSIAAGIVGAIGLLFSVILATGALLIALDVDQGGAFFAHLSDACDGLVGPLKDVFSFSGVNADKKEALVGWGLGSMGYLLVGCFVQSILMSRVKD